MFKTFEKIDIGDIIRYEGTYKETYIILKISEKIIDVFILKSNFGRTNKLIYFNPDVYSKFLTLIKQ